MTEDEFGGSNAIVSVSPPGDTTVSSTTSITVAFRPSDGGDYTLELDGRDVSQDCVLRETMSMPAGRIELTYRPGAPLMSGRHTAVARSSSGQHSWSFTVE